MESSTARNNVRYDVRIDARNNVKVYARKNVINAYKCHIYLQMPETSRNHVRIICQGWGSLEVKQFVDEFPS
jgi:hypothetical protein